MNVFLYQRTPGSASASRRGPFAYSSSQSSCESSSNSRPSPWAIKKLRGSRSGNASFRPELARRMEREAEILRSLSHPHIIGYRGFRRSTDGTRILAIENGEKSLLDMIEEITEEEEVGEMNRKHFQTTSLAVGSSKIFFPTISYSRPSNFKGKVSFVEQRP